MATGRQGLAARPTAVLALALGLLVPWAAATAAGLEHVPRQRRGSWVSSNGATLGATPDSTWAALTGDVLPWWDHHVSESPLRMVIEPRPGGSFLEIVDGEGHGIRHGVVIAALPPLLLRVDGPLGLAGRAVDLVTTWRLTATAGGDCTAVTVTCSFDGQVDSTLAGAVHRVQRHFLVERLKPFVEGRPAEE